MVKDEEVLAGLLALGLLAGRPKEVKPPEKPPEKEEVPPPPEEKPEEVEKPEEIVDVIILNNLEENVKLNINGKDYVLEPQETVELQGKAPYTVDVKLYYPWSYYATLTIKDIPGYRWAVKMTYQRGGSYIISIDYIPELRPKPEEPIPEEKVEYVTLSVKAVADSKELSIDVEGYEGGMWTTPFEEEVVKGKVTGYLVPEKVTVDYLTYRLSSVEGGTISVVGAGKALIKVLADSDKTVVIRYVQVRPEEPKWVCDFGRQGKIKVYDVWYDRERKVLGVDIEVVCGTTGSEVDLVGADIIASDFPSRGTYVNGSVGCGRRLVTDTIKYEWYFDYGIVISAKWRYGGATVALTIRNEEIRRI